MRETNGTYPSWKYYVIKTLVKQSISSFPWQRDFPSFEVLFFPVAILIVVLMYKRRRQLLI